MIILKKLGLDFLNLFIPQNVNQKRRRYQLQKRQLENQTLFKTHLQADQHHDVIQQVILQVLF